MQVKSSCNCCINIWDEQLDNPFDIYVIFPEYVGDQPMMNGTLELLEQAYEEIDNMESCKLTKEYIEIILEENDIEYVKVICKLYNNYN